ncbi:MAG: hypothetical protein AB8H86_02920 [Polyangiales bacterium]
MRFTLICCFSLLFVACASDVNRYEGEGCQPSCRVIETEGDAEDDRFAAECLTPDFDSVECVVAPTPACSSGVLTCDTADGLPRCEGAPEAMARPVCSR